MRISDWSSDVCSSDLCSKICDRTAVDQRFAPNGTNLAGDLVGCCARASGAVRTRTQIVYYDLGSPLGEKEGVGAPQAPAGARHDGNLDRKRTRLNSSH